jgi:hypothetical protein
MKKTPIANTEETEKQRGKKNPHNGVDGFFTCMTQISGVPKGIRTPVLTVKG